MSLRAFALEWLATKEHETAPATYIFYRNSIERLLEHLGAIADEPISEITKSDLVAFRNALSTSGLASKTVNHHIKCAKMLFRAARRDGALSEDQPSSSIPCTPAAAAAEYEPSVLSRLRRCARCFR